MTTTHPRSPHPESARVVIVGCGGVGGVCAAGLRAHGIDVTVVAGRAAIADKINKHGLEARIDGATKRVQLPAVVSVDELGDEVEPFDLGLLATPPDAVTQAAPDLLRVLKDDAPVVPFQNGLAEERLGAHVPPARIIGGIVAYGASMIEPGIVEKTSSGGYTVGRLDGRIDAQVRFVEGVLSRSAEVDVVENLRGARWSKLAINCAISSLGTIGGQRLGALMRHRFVRRLCLETMTEVTRVALAEGVRLEKVSGTLDLEWLALTDEERRVAGSPGLLAKHTVLLAVGAKYRRLRSSMLAAIERGREPPVDFLNGEVVRRAEPHGLPAPINAALSTAVRQVSDGAAAPSVAYLRSVFDKTRDTLRALDLAA